MTEVIFYVGLSDRMRFLSKFLATRIVGGDRRAVLLFDDEDLSQETSKHLWESERELFIPNCYVDDEHAEMTPVLLALADRGRPPASDTDVLVNLTSKVPEGFESFDRLVELAEEGGEAAQEILSRREFYEERGYKVTRHDMTGRRY